MEPADCRPVRMPELRADARKATLWDARSRAESRGRTGLDPRDVTAVEMLDAAELFWVSGDMSQLCRDAVEDLSQADLGRDLWPCESGFMLFETPVPVDGAAWLNANDQSLEPIRAIQWYPETGPSGEHVTVLLFVDVSDILNATAVRLEAEQGRTWTEDERRRHADTWASEFGFQWLSPAGGASHRLDEPVTAAAHEGDGAPAAFMLSTVWLLMNQRGLAQVTTGLPVPKNKSARRRQAGVRDQLDGIRIVEIRAGTDHAAAYTGTTRTHRHRWMVKGHWRRQWYPSAGENRPMWIAPHVKGPEGAPMLTGQKVHVWKGR